MAGRREPGPGDHALLTVLAESPAAPLSGREDGREDPARVIPFRAAADGDEAGQPLPFRRWSVVPRVAQPRAIDVVVRPFADALAVLIVRAERFVASPPPLPVFDVVRVEAAARTLARRIALGSALVLIAGGLLATRGTWTAWLRPAAKPAVAAPVAAPAPSLPAEPAVAPEVAEAIGRLPHLAPETVQALMARHSGRRPPEPAEVFRLAHLAAARGAALLAEDETRDLAALRARMAGALSRPDRDRVLAYDRLSPVRDLLVGEDARVMALVARGARALRAEDRARVQALLGKAIAGHLAEAEVVTASSGAPDAGRGTR